MSKLMVIDGAHPEETRAVVINKGIIEEFDYQNTYKKSTKGNIYLAKVIRVEPSLQAAFVDYGGERHAFLPFPEIHPSYYQLPKVDKEALLSSMVDAEDKELLLDENRKIEQFDIEEEGEEEVKETKNTKDTIAQEPAEGDTASEGEEAEAELISSEAEGEENSVGEFRPDFYKNYKIQEVIKKDQVLLIQIVKEERGNKGASVTTYISLAGRYCVLMPNSIRAGGVSRKIMDNQERQRLKSVADELNEKASTAASVIVRTAGAHKTKTEVKRDFNYLIRLWNNIREHTLASKAPAFIHEEGDVIKKSIRDLYNSDMEQILVAGDEAYENARKFMELILPKRVDSVKKYKGKSPIFVKYNIENQLNTFYDPVAPLKSGGYLVINHTEALVAIDVNSGRATSERNVENTAVKTNMEAAREIARQIKLRDLSGLIVIDFIDMEDSRNRRTVEREFKEALSNDRARIQVNRISMFGLLEMTRQRLRKSFFESSTHVCAHCDGRGRIRPVEATAIAVLRALDNDLAEGSCDEIQVSGSEKLMFYILNNKREEISKLEKSHKVRITFYTDEEAGADGFFIEKSKKTKEEVVTQSALSAIDVEPYAVEEPAEEEDSSAKRKWKTNAKKPTFREQEREVEHGHKRVDKRKGKGVNNNRFKNKENRAPVKEIIPYDYEEDNAFEENMEKKRKQNQSFLKEIWKKIVE
ncbi:Ribonuclease Rne/Rng family protein [Candidatus Jidaibacter acanthamoeba]|uniref:Ribonuclease Rne/Rng family protein n=1 Tax=Candidatus Jidaibacter acanthamoebae TaxID=86105 RepID=A0A0C1N008_9RICK|nr:Rne/Rng family ribonuclease [Candidatus Jidaibacter acanthamoeba]KIE05656.1 Ribonuclease Rne/Rng family protein [Candidatus Jidaibacter acanthamoeba]